MLIPTVVGRQPLDVSEDHNDPVVRAPVVDLAPRRLDEVVSEELVDGAAIRLRARTRTAPPLVRCTAGATPDGRRARRSRAGCAGSSPRPRSLGRRMKAGQQAVRLLLGGQRARRLKIRSDRLRSALGRGRGSPQPQQLDVPETLSARSGLRQQFVEQPHRFIGVSAGEPRLGQTAREVRRHQDRVTLPAALVAADRSPGVNHRDERREPLIEPAEAALRDASVERCRREPGRVMALGGNFHGPIGELDRELGIALELRSPGEIRVDPAGGQRRPPAGRLERIGKTQRLPRRLRARLFLAQEPEHHRERRARDDPGVLGQVGDRLEAEVASRALELLPRALEMS